MRQVPEAFCSESSTLLTESEDWGKGADGPLTQLKGTQGNRHTTGTCQDLALLTGRLSLLQKNTFRC